jgi:2-oxoacid:acceptor oxidoreductase gamma subunit (pyruvate/2-ketoisovalerate family)
LKEIRWHGRGGNGAFTAAKLLGSAASIYEGKFSQAFPAFGPERRGAPVAGFTRISEEVITDHSQVYECDCVIVLDETLCDVVDVTVGMKSDAVLLINSEKTADEVRKEKNLKNIKNIVTIDATSIALEKLGRPIVNTVMLGAAMGITQLVSLTSLEEAIGDMMKGALGEKNKTAARIAYDKTKGAC